MNIYCSGCKKYLGEIRDGTLMKRISYLCPKCETKRIASDLAKKNSYNPDIGDLFNGIFNGVK
jgi:hypothetical protein